MSKKIMILGASILQLPAIEKAKERIPNLVDGRAYVDDEEKYMHVWYDTCDHVLVGVKEVGLLLK